MQDLNDLYYYVQVVNYGGFSPAGRALNQSKSKLSRRIAILEERLGVRLIQRSTRQFAVTEIGQTYYEHCKAMLIEAEAAQDAIDVTRAEPRGIIKMTCPVALLQVSVGPILSDFMVKYPHVTIHLEATDRRADPIGEAIDLAIRVLPPPIQNSDLIMRTLSDRGQCLAASPLLLERFGIPATPEDLADWPSLGLGTPQKNHVWRLCGADSRNIELFHTPRFITSDMITLRNAAVEGVGIVQLPYMMICEQLNNGSLVRLLPEWQLKREIIHVVFPSRRGLLPSVRTLIDYLAERFAALPED